MYEHSGRLLLYLHYFWFPQVEATAERLIPVTNQIFRCVFIVSWRSLVCRRLLSLDIRCHMCLDDLTPLLTDLRIHLVACLWRPSLTFHFPALHQVPNRFFSLHHGSSQVKGFVLCLHSPNRVRLDKPTLSLDLLPLALALHRVLSCTVMYCQTILHGLHWCRTFKPLMATWSCLKSLYVQLKRLVSIVWSRLKWCQDLLQGHEEGYKCREDSLSLSQYPPPTLFAIAWSLPLAEPLVRTSFFLKNSFFLLKFTFNSFSHPLHNVDGSLLHSDHLYILSFYHH